MTADASDVLPCCGGSEDIKIQRSGQRRHGPADTPVETDFEAPGGTRQQGRHIIIGNIPEEEESAFRGHNLLYWSWNSPGNKTGGKQASYRLKE